MREAGSLGWTSRPVVWLTVCWTLGYAAAMEWSFLRQASLYLLFGGLLLLLLVWSGKPRGRLVLAAVLIVCIAAGWYGMFDNRNRTLITPPPAVEEVDGVRFVGRIDTPVNVDGDKVMFQAVAERVELPEQADGQSAVSAGVKAVEQTVSGNRSSPRPEENGESDVRKSLPSEGRTPVWDVTSSGKGERVQVSIRLLQETEQRMALAWKRGDRIELSGILKLPGEARNFGAFDYRGYLQQQHIHWQLSGKGLEGVQVTEPSQSDWGWWRLARWNDDVRFGLGAVVDRLFPAGQAGFMKGMLIGLTDEIEPEQFDSFSRLGLTHIIAISGLNVAIFLACVIWLLRRIGMTREAYLWTAMALLPLYIAMTGAAPSIVRAGLMAMIGLYAAYRHRLKDGLHLVMIVGLVMLLWNPYYITDVSFQLSFLVTLGIIVLVSRVSGMLPVRNKKWRDALAITLVAQFVSFPLTIYYFNQFSLLSFAANLALVPVFSSFTMPVGTTAMLVGLVSSTVGGWLAWPVGQVNRLLFATVQWSGELPGSQTIWPTPSLLWIIGYYGLLTGSVLAVEAVLKGRSSAKEGPMLDTWQTMRWKERLQAWNGKLLVPGLVLLFAALLWVGYRPEWRSPPQGMVQTLDVGQGDSILIRTGNSGHTLLVDGGGTVSFRKPGEEWKNRSDPYEVGRKLLVPLLKKRGVQQIDELILTHQDADHFGGLQAVLEHIPVKRLLFNGTLKPIPGVEQLFRTALAHGTQLVPIQAGDRLKVSSELELYFLAPFAGQAGEREQVELKSDQNPVSLVFLMELAGTRWLFTGDIGVREEDELLTRWKAASGSKLPISLMEQPIDVLKVAHHGSKSSTSETWLDVWQPRVALISAGLHNTYGHPSPQVTERLKQRRIAVYRTDRDGEVQLQVRDGKVEVRTKLGNP
ncbi:DNA internalization-related competence protein ComEC/Rec2 [Paenibacillus filicis]|uniref:DNA internalization-related competence protein ComEC/Rec2 n=1 Tax=Paenibacillus filicis TaxID=669464 RepID=A0ABU9DMD2_9BACL